MSKFVEKIEVDGDLYAMVIRGSFNQPGITFFTPDNLSQQVAFMSHSKDKTIQPHVHKIALREVEYTQEVLVIRKGKLRVDFYDEKKNYLENRILEAGDLILLVKGGHGFQVVEDVEMFEIKQGPYMGEKVDKERFEATPRV